MQFAKYDDSGRVLFTGDVPEAMLALQGERVFVGSLDGQTQYVQHGQAVPRPDNPARQDGLHLHNLPVPCSIVINGRSYACNEEHAELEFTYPGSYRITVVAFPYLDKTFTAVKTA